MKPLSFNSLNNEAAILFCTLPGWHLMASGLDNNYIRSDASVSGKRWYLRDQEIVNGGAGNKFSKKLP